MQPFWARADDFLLSWTHRRRTATPVDHRLIAWALGYPIDIGEAKHYPNMSMTWIRSANLSSSGLVMRLAEAVVVSFSPLKPIQTTAVDPHHPVALHGLLTMMGFWRLDLNPFTCVWMYVYVRSCMWSHTALYVCCTQRAQLLLNLNSFGPIWTYANEILTPDRKQKGVVSALSISGFTIAAMLAFIAFTATVQRSITQSQSSSTSNSRKVNLTQWQSWQDMLLCQNKYMYVRIRTRVFVHSFN
jgi:hypothetical protein